MARHLITSALPYINGIKHLGNMVGSMLPADVYARYLRQRGHDVLYICATDEHGTPAELAAKEQGLPVAEFCAQAHDAQKAVYDGFALAFDYFGRSSSPQNREITQHFARRLNENGFIEERAIRQVYSPTDGRFLPDRYVEGTCPHCGYDKARGDQCENCTRVLDPTDLINPRSAISGSTDLEVRETKHLFLLQSKLQHEVEEWVAAHEEEWPQLASSIARKWLTEGLHDRAITRDLDWGVPVPADTWPELAAEGKVFYVWFDAPIEYIGATKEWSDAAPAGETRDWKSWWYESDATVRYTEFMAKDNVPFHTVMFPATELGIREPWKKVDYVKAFNWLTYYGGKFSTSQKRGVFTDQALDILPADYWRYFPHRQRPRVRRLVVHLGALHRHGEQGPGGHPRQLRQPRPVLLEEALRRGGPGGRGRGRGGDEARRTDRGTPRRVREPDGGAPVPQGGGGPPRPVVGGQLLPGGEGPWLEIKTDPEAAALTLRTAMNLIHLYAVVSEPFIPSSSAAMRQAFALKDTAPDQLRATWVSPEEAKSLNAVPAGTPFIVPPVLFAKLTDEDLETYKERFGGDQG